MCRSVKGQEKEVASENNGAAYVKNRRVGFSRKSLSWIMRRSCGACTRRRKKLLVTSRRDDISSVLRLEVGMK